MVLGGAPDQRRAADIDILDAGVEPGAPGHRRLERVEVDDHQIDGGDAMRGHRRLVFGIAANAEDAAMHGRMQGLDAAVEHFREAGVVGHLLDRQSGVAQGLGRAAGRQDLHAVVGQRPGEVYETRLVGDGNKGAADGHGGLGHQRVSS